MSSILTNTGAMTALSTLRSINASLGKVQDQISTGKSVATAKDNAAVWAISKVMESDVAGFKAISASLALGESTVAVGRQAAETTTKLLNEIKGKIVASQEENVDRTKIQTDIDRLTSQIKAVVGAAQFNGLNLVQGTEDVSVLGSLDRAGNGSVTASDITVSRQDLSTVAGKAGTTAAIAGGYASVTTSAGAAGGKIATTTATTADPVGATTTAATGNYALITAAAATGTENFSVTVAGKTVSQGTTGAATATVVRDGLLSQLQALGLEDVTFAAEGTGQIRISNTRGFEGLDVATASTVNASLGITSYNNATAFTAAVDSIKIDQRATSLDFSGTAAVKEGDTYSLSLAGVGNFQYIAGKDESMEDVARGMKLAIDATTNSTVSAMVQKNGDQWRLAVDDSTGGRALSLDVTTGGEASGGLFGLDDLDVSTNESADAALANIETLIKNSIDAAAGFGSDQGRIEIQAEFIQGLTDSLRAGIGSLVDADMEEASARLQALQVQQQLGVQALSIANQAPQSILSLFR